MIFQDNVIKEYLKNVYFITGTPCGGKTTVSRALAEKYGFELFDVDYNGKTYPIAALPENLMDIIQAGGLVKAMRKRNGLD